MDKKYKIFFTADALYDLKQIKHYLDGYDPSIFYTLFDKIKNHMSILEIHPYINMVFLIHRGIEYRRLNIKEYRVIYNIDESDNVVYIDRCFHYREDYYEKM